MTSPGINKPSHEVEGYETVHSRGSSFGQGLDEDTVRQMLMGQEASPIQEAVTGAVEFLVGIGTGLANTVFDLFGWDREPMPPLWEEFSAEAYKALEPLYSQADRAIEKAEEAQRKTENLNEELTGSIEGDFSDAIENYHGALGRLAQSVDGVTAQIPEVTQAAEAVAQAQQAVDAALEDLTVEINRTHELADRVDQSSQEYQDQVEAANAAAKRVEDAVADYSSRVSAAEQILSDMQATQEATSNAAQEVQGLVGTPEWDEAVTGFIYWQNQLNEENSDFQRGVTSALAALQMVQDKNSDFNKAVQDALDAQEDINSKQDDFNRGVSAALDALAMVEEEQSDFNKGVRTAIDALETFANLQDEVNRDVRNALEDLAGVADVSQIHWQTQADYNRQNNIINRAQNEALMMHENQLMMLDDSRPRSWVFYTSQRHDRAPWISVRINDHNLGRTSTVDLTALGSWAGRVLISISFYDQGTGSDSAVDQYDWLVVPGDPDARTTTFRAGAVHMGIRNVAVTLYPFWGVRKREFLLEPYEYGSSPGYALRRNESYVNDMEGNPLDWNYQDSVRLPSRTVNMHGVTVTSPAKMVTANQGTYVYSEVDKLYHFTPEGTWIPAGAWIRSETDNLLVLTEV